MKRIVLVLGVLEDEDVDWLVATGQRRELQAGEVIIREGQPCEEIFLILDGQLEVSVLTLSDQPLAQLSTGEVVGEMSFVDGQPPSATVVASESTVVLALPCNQVRHQLEQDIGFAARFYKAMAIVLSSRLRSTVKHLQGQHWRPVTPLNEAELDEWSDLLSMGSIRFDWMLKRLRDLSSNPWEGLEETQVGEEKRGRQ